MKRIFLWIMLGVFCGCGDSQDIDQRYRHQVHEKVFYVSKRYELQPYGSGGFNHNGISGFTFMYKLFGDGEEVSARNLLVSFVEDLIQSVNNSSEHLLTIDNFDIYIFFYTPGNYRPNTIDKGLAEVSLIDGDVLFSVDRNGTFDLDTIHSEPYAEAYEKVMGKKYEPSVPKI